MADDDVDRRIREMAHRIWEDEGRPDDKADEHWERARMIVATQDGLPSTLKPVDQPQSEPLEAVRNLGEFPNALTDQGDRPAYPDAEQASRRDDTQ